MTWLQAVDVFIKGGLLGSGLVLSWQLDPLGLVCLGAGILWPLGEKCDEDQESEH